MGTWGKEPKDNDSTWDLWGYCCDATKTIARIADAMEAILTRTAKAKVIRMHSRKAVAAAQLRRREVLAWNGWPRTGTKRSWTGIEVKLRKSRDAAVAREGLKKPWRRSPGRRPRLVQKASSK